MTRNYCIMVLALLVSSFFGGMKSNSVLAIRSLQSQQSKAVWTLEEVRFTTDSASPSSPGKLKVVVTEGQKTPSNASVILQISFQADRGAPLSINISPDEGETTFSGSNSDNIAPRPLEYMFNIPKNQGTGNAIVIGTAKLIDPKNSTISGMTDRTSTNTLIVNK